jgi:hypothetical protein
MTEHNGAGLIPAKLRHGGAGSAQDCSEYWRHRQSNGKVTFRPTPAGQDGLGNRQPDAECGPCGFANHRPYLVSPTPDGVQTLDQIRGS